MRVILFTFSILVSAPAFAADKMVEADKDKLVCKREVPTGSLIASRKTCLTKAQWNRLAEDQQYEAEKMVERNRGLIAR